MTKQVDGFFVAVKRAANQNRDDAKPDDSIACIS